jgi:succinyl-CoA synthetase beta subunit
LIEINPLVLTNDGQIIAADSKITVDDNAVFRQPEIKAEEDTSQHNYKERIAKTFDLNYIYIGGNIGCLVNGAAVTQLISSMSVVVLKASKWLKLLNC